MSSRWTVAVIADALAAAVWGLAASKGHGWEMIWLPAVAMGAAWPTKP